MKLKKFLAKFVPTKALVHVTLEKGDRPVKVISALAYEVTDAKLLNCKILQVEAINDVLCIIVAKTKKQDSADDSDTPAKNADVYEVLKNTPL